MSVNNIVGLGIKSDFKHSCVSLIQLNEDLPWKDYVNSITDVFMDKSDKSRHMKRFGRTRLEQWLKKTITFDPTVG